MVDEYPKCNYKQIQLNLGAACPPRSTLDGWTWRRRHGAVLATAGRPTALTSPEEEYVRDAVKYLWSKGAAVDREIVICMAQKCVAACRNLTPAQVPELSEHWCRSFRKRHHLTRLRRATTDRGITTVEQGQADNAWREEYARICAQPARYGIEMPAGGPPHIVLSMQLAADETPILYAPPIRGCYEEEGRAKQVWHTPWLCSFLCLPSGHDYWLP